MNKQLFLLFGMAAVVVVLVIGMAKISGSSDSASDIATDMSDHNSAQASSEEYFQSLLNKKAPDFTLESYDGKEIRLKDLRGKRVVLFFTEGLMCYPSCWNQMASFGDDRNFNNKDTITLSIAVDKKEDWKQAIDKMPQLSKAIVLFDTRRQVSKEYGVLSLPSSMHKGLYPGHTYLIIDRDGIVKYVMDDPNMGIRNNELTVELGKIN